MKNGIIYTESQHLGSNKYSLNRRLVLAVFCFLTYFYSEQNPELGIGSAANYLFVMGLFVLVLSVALLLVLFLKTEVRDGRLTLDGLWTSREVKLDLRTIVSIEPVRYSKFFLNRPVYNLHRRGTVRFYCSGRKAVELADKDGLIYLIGTQKQDELVLALRKTVESN